MHVVFIEPGFPSNQREFVRGLHAAGAKVTGIGERPLEALDGELQGWLYKYERVGSVVDEGALLAAVRRIQAREPVGRLEATVEAHIMAAAHVREAAGIPGTSARSAWLCRDKPAMKEVLRQAGISCAASAGADSPDAVRQFAKDVGFPLILKPRDAAGASGTCKVGSWEELERALPSCGFERGGSIAVEEFIEGHEGFFDTISIDGEVVHEFVSHYYPNVLDAMRSRWISPQFLATNRVDAVRAYDEVKVMGRKVIRALGIGTSATHMEWFFGPKGLKFSEIGCRPPGVRAWDLYCHGNEMDLYREWAMALVHGRPAARPSRRFAAGIVALRPDRDGRISHHEGVDALRERFGAWLIDWHLPDPGTPTQPVEAGYMANAWVRMKHPDYDELRAMLNWVGENVRVRAH